MLFVLAVFFSLLGSKNSVEAMEGDPPPITSETSGSKGVNPELSGPQGETKGTGSTIPTKNQTESDPAQKSEPASTSKKDDQPIVEHVSDTPVPEEVTEPKDLPPTQPSSAEKNEAISIFISKGGVKNEAVCKIICSDSNVFPLTLEHGDPREVDVQKFKNHLKKMGMTSVDVKGVMELCGDAKTAPCMKKALDFSLPIDKRIVSESTTLRVLVVLIILAVLVFLRCGTPIRSLLARIMTSRRGSSNRLLY